MTTIKPRAPARRTASGNKTASGKETFLTAEQVLNLSPRRAWEVFPDKIAAEHRIFTEGKGLPPASALNTPIEYTLADQKRLAEWYRASPEPVAEADGLDLDAKTARGVLQADGKDLSLPGFLPDHLDFHPLPPLALIDPRLRDLIAPHQDAVMSPRIRIDKPSMRVYPWCTIGKVFKSYPPYTSDALVASGFMFGGRVMITARHVFPSNIHDSFAWGARYRFAPGWDGTVVPAEPFGSARVVAVRGKEKDSGILWASVNGSDYAACKLDWRIGDLSGALGVYCFGDSDSYKNRFYNSAGYPDFNNTNPVQELLVQVRDVDGGYRERELETRNFAGPGWSGGPLFGYLNESGDTRVVGVCSGKERFDSFLPPWSNLVFAGGRRFVDLAQYTVDHWWT